MQCKEVNKYNKSNMYKMGNVPLPSKVTKEDTST